MMNRPKKYNKSASKKKKNDSSDETSEDDDSDDENFVASGRATPSVSRSSARLGSQTKKRYAIDEELYDFEKEESNEPEVVYPIIEKILAMRKILKTDLSAEVALEKSKISITAKQRYADIIKAKNPTPQKQVSKSSTNKYFIFKF